MPDYTEQLNQVRAEEKKRVKAEKKRIRKEARTKKSVKKLSKRLSDPTREISEVEFFFVLIIALANDACDFAGIDLFLFRAIDLITAGILGLWCIVRLHKFPTARFAGTFLMEIIPGLGEISPTWTIFIISVYLSQKGRLPWPISKLSKTKTK